MPLRALPVACTSHPHMAPYCRRRSESASESWSSTCSSIGAGFARAPSFVIGTLAPDRPWPHSTSIGGVHLSPAVVVFGSFIGSRRLPE